MLGVIARGAGVRRGDGGPEGLPSFLQKLLAIRREQTTPIDAFFATHPTDETRIVALQWQIASLPAPKAALVRDSPDFDDIQKLVRALPAPPKRAAADSTSSPRAPPR